jgi:hypothetical protein
MDMELLYRIGAPDTRSRFCKAVVLLLLKKFTTNLTNDTNRTVLLSNAAKLPGFGRNFNRKDQGEKGFGDKTSFCPSFFAFAVNFFFIIFWF